MQLTLTNRLRLAALTRAEHGGRVVGTFVIDDEGVIDLRALEDRGPANRASAPASLKETAGLYGDAADVSDLYVETHQRRRRKRRRRAKQKPESSPVAIDSSSAETRDGADEPDAQIAKHDSPKADDVALATPDRAAESDGVELRSASADAATDDRTAPADEGDEDDEVMIDLRAELEVSDLQKAIIEFNKLGPIVDMADVDIESGIRFGNGRSATGHDYESQHFEPIKHFNRGPAPDPTSATDRGALFGSDNSPPEVVSMAEIDGDDVGSDVTEHSPIPPVSPSDEHTEIPPISPSDEHSQARISPSDEHTQARISPSDEHSPIPPISPSDEHTQIPPISPSDEAVTPTQPPAAAEGGPNLLCPMCGGAATRDFANRLFEIDFYSCSDCFHMWHLEAEDGD